MNLNIDAQTLEQCLKSINNIGNTVYHNICTGEIYSIPWGGEAWFGALFT